MVVCASRSGDSLAPVSSAAPALVSQTKHPQPHSDTLQGGPPSTVLLLCLPGIGWAQRDAVLEALQPSTPLSVMQLHSGARLEVPSQTLANLVTVARPKRGREGEDGQVSAPGPRPLEFYAATARQMAAAGYPGCEESGATHVPEGYASTADFPSELVWWIRAWAGAFSTHPCPPPITSSPSIAPPPLPPLPQSCPGRLPSWRWTARCASRPAAWS